MGSGAGVDNGSLFYPDKALAVVASLWVLGPKALVFLCL